MTFKELKLPEKIYIVFDNDEEVYMCWLMDIGDVNEDEDECVLLVEDLMPQSARLIVPYSSLKGNVMHLAGVHIYLNREDAEKKARA